MPIRFFSPAFCAASMPICKTRLDVRDSLCSLQVQPKVNEDLLQQLQEMGFSRNK